MKKILHSICFILLLTACSQVGASSKFEAPNYTKFGKTRLDVNEIQVVNAYVPPYTAPNVEHELYLPPYSAIRDWGLNRFQAVGNMGIAKIHIMDASVVKNERKIKSGAEGWFYDQVQADYKLSVLVRLEITSPSYENLPYAEVRAARTLEVTEGMTLNQRDAALNKMVIDMLDDLDRLMTESIRNNLGNIVR
ncbi:MAG TPA: hypothetical protein PKW15_05365 [Alphaproteobacteria bacterium]|nr:hypothetical protein [Rhodospirillaceae bacterium]HRJ12654.1 hypothetical protein [Alphaproteobacteria bacterium]